MVDDNNLSITLFIILSFRKGHKINEVMIVHILDHRNSKLRKLKK